MARGQASSQDDTPFSPVNCIVMLGLFIPQDTPHTLLAQLHPTTATNEWPSLKECLYTQAAARPPSGFHGNAPSGYVVSLPSPRES